MGEYTVTFAAAAARQFRKLPAQVQQRLSKKIDRLAVNPRPHGYEPLEGEPGYRIRVGDYRVVYDIQDSVLVVLVLNVAHRRHVYDR
jgi:mRNA interferase RelE/StbE